MHAGGAVEGQTIQINGMDMYVESEDRIVVIAFHDARTSDSAIALART